MNAFYAALVLGCLVLTNIASGDPLVQFPTGSAAWTVAITYPKSKDASAPKAMAGNRAKKIEITQVDDLKRVRITWTKGQCTEQWTVRNLPVVFKEFPNGDVFPVKNGDMETQSDDFNMPCDLSAFSWVTPASLKEKDPVKHQGQLCYHYVGTVNAPAMRQNRNAEPEVLTTAKREAWINSTTLRPVALDTETSRSVFTFQQPPTAPLEMPAKFQQGIASYKHIMGFP
jgi:hypothetical protein